MQNNICGFKTNNPRAGIQYCDECDKCNSCHSNVHICTFVVSTLEEGRVFRDSFIFNQEDDSVYYISNDGSETAFGSRPMFIDNYNPASRNIKRQLVFDYANNKGYVHDPEGKVKVFDLKEA